MKIKPSLVWLWGVLLLGVGGVVAGVVLGSEAWTFIGGGSIMRVEIPGEWEFDVAEPGRYSIVPDNDLLPDRMTFSMIHLDSGEAIEIERENLHDLLNMDGEESDNLEWLEFDVVTSGTLQLTAEAPDNTLSQSDAIDVLPGSFGTFMRSFIYSIFCIGGGLLIAVVGLIVVLAMRASNRKTQQLAAYQQGGW
jgi:hypothetical protein